VEAAVLFTVFGVTGSSTMFAVRPALKKIGLEGTMQDGPWSYRIGSVLIISPIYSMILITIGTLSGRHLYFARMTQKLLGRFVPSTAAKQKIACEPARNKLKVK
jgi:hypothetical protein